MRDRGALAPSCEGFCGFQSFFFFSFLGFFTKEYSILGDGRRSPTCFGVHTHSSIAGDEDAAVRGFPKQPSTAG